MFASLILLLFLSPLGSSFIFDKPAVPLADLGQLFKTQHEKRVSVDLNIDHGEGSRLAVKGMVFDLMEDPASSKSDFKSMPGNYWPRSSFTGGLHAMNTVEDGVFVSMNGNTVVKPLKGCWEIIWREGDPGGYLYCGLDIDQEYKRNDATLPKGNIYVSFSVWSAKGLKEYQDRKERSQERANSALKKKSDELAKMAETTNLFEKGLHYYNALCAADAYLMEPKKMMKFVPSTEDVLEFADDMYIGKTGSVWVQDSPHSKVAVLGAATLGMPPKTV
jgi:hypothetical protein